MAELLWLNGALVAPGEAVVSVLDHGFTVGDGVFETIKALDGRPFAVRRHLDRLHRSAQRLGLVVPHTDDVLRQAISDVVASQASRDLRVRVTVTGGEAPLGSDRGASSATVVVAAAPLAAAPSSAAVCTVPWPRNERGALAGVKSTSYAENVVALAWAKERGASEAVFANTVGQLCEGTGSNVFAVIEGRLLTPPLSSGCLAGVTRELLLEVTDAVEQDISMEAFHQADEVFLTGTGRDVLPVSRVDDRDLPAPGPLTQIAGAAFRALMTSTDDP